MQALLDWLSALPPIALYPTMFVVAMVENFFPPIPADVTVAFGAFLAARGGHSAMLPFLAVWLGNVSGAFIMYRLGRRYGAEWIRRRLGAAATASAEARVRAWYERWGVASFFVSRFLPAVRALVPPFAGALELPPVGPMIAIASASGLWYGLINWLAFRAGANWNDVQAMMARYARGITIVALVLAGIAIAVWLVRRRTRETSAG